MEIVINKIWLQWIVFIVFTVVMFVWADKESSSPGFASGIGAIIPLFWWLVGVIIWLIIFFVIF